MGFLGGFLQFFSFLLMIADTVGCVALIIVDEITADDPELLLLDDCSSALDYKTDRALRRALRKQYANATTVLVAQRVSAVMAADHIIVMDGGRMVGYGTHETLRNECPLYQALCVLQLGKEAV